mgnify:FL=1
MDRDNGSNRRGIDSTDESEISVEQMCGLDTERKLMSAYDEIDGTPMYIIAAVDSDRAWIAISDGDEIDPTGWC